MLRAYRLYVSAHEDATGVCAVVDAEDVYASRCIGQVEGVCVAVGVDVANDCACHRYKADVDVLGSRDADFVCIGSGSSDEYALLVNANVVDA